AATAARAARAGVGDLVATRQLALQDVAAADALPADVTFDGVLSNFGGLNTVGDWRGLAAALAARVRVGGTAVLVPMGPVCPWETAWHVLHGEWETAVRRRRAPATAVIGGRAIPVWYPAARTLRRAFAPWFTAVRCESLGLWLPPSHLGHLVARHPRFFRGAARLEQATARWTGGWGDHYVLVLRRV
ncbi:MAG: hypothetical protein KC425_09805, partial [Anaerolineales bacterium]|nr:hypothetical protein [Anaerolineales bacterium]